MRIVYWSIFMKKQETKLSPLQASLQQCGHLNELVETASPPTHPHGKHKLCITSFSELGFILLKKKKLQTLDTTSAAIMNKEQT
jgi:hypothetical protein